MSGEKKRLKCMDCQQWDGYVSCKRNGNECFVERSSKGECGPGGKYFEPKKVDA
jgi:hypothetical protein